MIMLILLQPAFPLKGAFGGSLVNSIVVVLAPLTALVAFRLIYHSTPTTCIKTLIGMMMQDVQDIAGGQRLATAGHETRHARLYRRLITLVRWMNKSSDQNIPALGGGLALQSLSTVALRAHVLLHMPDITPGTARRLQTLLKRMRSLKHQPEHVIRALDRTATRLTRDFPVEARLLRETAHVMQVNAAFFDEARGAR
ncbi:FUSC family protein [Pusillimonas sp. ANT_WB101]|uniref:FUSC family protein n=1 Tax=Pusillimonas sp. ANT_WB101 TaxID=2597356 RepID=UPI0011EC2800|nr:FUSC family protein [Pusillimonas sp. ANT_WB101]KAA0890801.1 hypothetical protein FQ179_14170 [Pusillimonas sp. ANT_WB101]